MFENFDWAKYLINIPKHNYQSNNTCPVTFVLIFLSCIHNIYILIVTRLFKKLFRSVSVRKRDTKFCTVSSPKNICRCNFKERNAWTFRGERDNESSTSIRFKYDSL